MSKQAQLKKNNEDVFLNIYKIGDIYITTNSENPADRFGGQWEQIKDRFLLCAGDTYVNGSTGGEAAHALTINEMPSHNHNPSDAGQNWVPNTGAMSRRNIALGNSGVYVPGPDNGINGWKWGGTSLTGGGQAHNNMPPYLVVYVWKRIG